MTNDRAVEIMKAIIFILKNDDYSDEVEEAIHMAISALQAQEKSQEVSNKSPELDNNFGELISRQAAVIQLSHNKCGNEENDIAVQHDIETIKNMPSAQPKRKKGRWVKETNWYGNIYYMCSECHRAYESKTDFCGSYGAKMEG